MAGMEFKLDGFDEFAEQLALINEKFPNEKRKALQRLAYRLNREIVLQLTEDEIVDTGRLRASFTVTSAGSNQSIPAPSGPNQGQPEGGSNFNGDDSIHVGTNVNYAKDVNDGFEITQHFVPGYWEGNKFNYVPYTKGSKVGGMTVHAQFRLGRHYMEKSLTRFKPIAEKELDKWIKNMMEKVESSDDE